MRYLLLLLLLLLFTSGAFAQPACTSQAPNAPACQSSATNFLPTDILLGQQATGPNRINQTVKVTPGNLQVTANGATQTLGSLAVPAYFSQVTCAGSDVAAALQADMNTAAAAGYGRYWLPKAQCIVSGANLTIPAGMSVVGNAFAVGYQNNNAYTTAPYTILLNSARNIIFSSNSGLSGVNVVRQGLTSPTTLRGFIQAAQAFAGTALSCQAGSTDVNVSNVLIIGFAQAVSTACDRFHGANIRGDDTAGLSMTACSDTCNLEDIEFWPFIANPYIGAPQEQVSNVSAAASDGGLIEITLSVAPSTPLVTGDTVVVGAVGGVPAATGRWTITVIDSTHLTLNSSAFSGTYTSGGVVVLNATIRTGAAFDIENVAGSPSMVSLLEFGYDIGMHYGGTTTGAYCTTCWLDSFTNYPYDPTPQGLLMDGATQAVNKFSGFVNTQGTAVKLNTSVPSASLVISDSQISLFGWQAGVASMYLAGANVQIGNSYLATGDSSPVSTIQVQDSLTSAQFGNDIFVTPGVATFTYQSAADCGKVSMNGTIGPCSWTPTLYGFSTAGTVTMASGYPVGSYTIANGSVSAWAHIVTTAISGAVGNAVMGGLPVAAGSSTQDNGDCAFGRIGGVTLTSGYTFMGASVTYGQTAIQLNQFGSGEPTLAINAGTELANATELQLVCHYHE